MIDILCICDRASASQISLSLSPRLSVTQLRIWTSELWNGRDKTCTSGHSSLAQRLQDAAAGQPPETIRLGLGMGKGCRRQREARHAILQKVEDEEGANW